MLPVRHSQEANYTDYMNRASFMPSTVSHVNDVLEDEIL